MIGAINSSRVDVTPREDGQKYGIPWSEVPANVAEGWVNLGAIMSAALPPGVLRVAWEVLGRHGTDNVILSVGTAVVDRVESLAVIRELVETHTHARIRLGVLGPSVILQVQEHATEAWEFRIRQRWEVS